MLQQALDFREESEAVFALLDGWTIGTGEGKRNSKHGRSTISWPICIWATTRLTSHCRIRTPFWTW